MPPRDATPPQLLDTTASAQLWVLGDTVAKLPIHGNSDTKEAKLLKAINNVSSLLQDGTARFWNGPVGPYIPDLASPETRQTASILSHILSQKKFDKSNVALQMRIDGVGMDDWLTEKHTLEEKAFVAHSLLAEITTYHNTGCAHADLKLDNVLIDENGNPTIIDMGLAKTTARQAFEHNSRIYMPREYWPSQPTPQTANSPLNNFNLTTHRTHAHKLRIDTIINHNSHNAYPITKVRPDQIDLWRLGAMLFMLFMQEPLPKNNPDTSDDTIRFARDNRSELIISQLSHICGTATDEEHFKQLMDEMFAQYYTANMEDATSCPAKIRSIIVKLLSPKSEQRAISPTDLEVLCLHCELERDATCQYLTDQAFTQSSNRTTILAQMQESMQAYAFAPDPKHSTALAASMKPMFQMTTGNYPLHIEDDNNTATPLQQLGIEVLRRVTDLQQLHHLGITRHQTTNNAKRNDLIALGYELFNMAINYSKLHPNSQPIPAKSGQDTVFNFIRNVLRQIDNGDDVHGAAELTQKIANIITDLSIEAEISVEQCSFLREDLTRKSVLNPELAREICFFMEPTSNEIKGGTRSFPSSMRVFMGHDDEPEFLRNAYIIATSFVNLCDVIGRSRNTSGIDHIVSLSKKFAPLLPLTDPSYANRIAAAISTSFDDQDADRRIHQIANYCRQLSATSNRTQILAGPLCQQMATSLSRRGDIRIAKKIAYTDQLCQILTEHKQYAQIPVVCEQMLIQLHAHLQNWYRQNRRDVQRLIPVPKWDATNGIGKLLHWIESEYNRLAQDQLDIDLIRMLTAARSLGQYVAASEQDADEWTGQHPDITEDQPAATVELQQHVPINRQTKSDTCKEILGNIFLNLTNNPTENTSALAKPLNTKQRLARAVSQVTGKLNLLNVQRRPNNLFLRFLRWVGSLFHGKAWAPRASRVASLLVRPTTPPRRRHASMPITASTTKSPSNRRLAFSIPANPQVSAITYNKHL